MRDGVETDGGSVGSFFESLPEGFLANALGLTSPMDACRLSLVCSVFRSAVEWDVLWEKFLPPDYQKILAEAEAEGGGGSVTSGSIKEMYLRLCDHPVIINGGNKSFSLDKCTGKKCYMLAARNLTIIWSSTPEYWRWISLPESRFKEVAELRRVCWLEVYGKINTSMLSTNTRYASYLVYKIASRNYGFESQPAEVSTRINGVGSEKMTVFILPGSARSNGPKVRLDGWLEIELGDYFNESGEGGELEMRFEVKGVHWKCGLVIQGIEIRPKSY